jgi:hypothetical protein
MSEPAIGWISEVVLDGPDPWVLARFWAGLADLASAHDRVIEAGATPAAEHVSPRPGSDGEPVPWRVYRDPAGHPFCLVIR